MKIAMICTEKLPVPPIRGGAIQQYISGVLPYLRQKHDITVFCREDDDLQSAETVDEVRYIRVPAPSTDEYIENVIEKLDPDYDLIHIYNRPLWVNLVGDKFPETKVSLSVHNEMLLPSKLPYSEGIRCIERVAFISTVSWFVADEIKKLYPQAEGKLHPVYSGVDVKEYKAVWFKRAIKIRKALREAHGLTDKKVVLYVGRLSPKKGGHILIKAMEKVAQSIPDTALVIVGSKWYGDNREDNYVDYIKHSADELPIPVVFTGFLPPSEVPSYYYVGDVFVCASQWREPLARVHYEAMAAGLPIITTDRGGNAEVVREEGNGIVIKDYDDPKAFAQAIEFLLDSPHVAEEIGRKGRKLAKEKYSWKRVAADLDQLFSNTNS